jgi:hypothetical protein
MSYEIIITIEPYKETIESENTFDPVPMLFFFHHLLDKSPTEAPELGPYYQKGARSGFEHDKGFFFIDPGMTISRTQVLPLGYYYGFLWKEKVMILRSLRQSILSLPKRIWLFFLRLLN